MNEKVFTLKSNFKEEIPNKNLKAPCLDITHLTVLFFLLFIKSQLKINE